MTDYPTDEPRWIRRVAFVAAIAASLMAMSILLGTLQPVAPIRNEEETKAQSTDGNDESTGKDATVILDDK